MDKAFAYDGLHRSPDVSLFLFGSLARGDYLLDSDIDLIVVTDGFRGLKPWERTATLRRIALRMWASIIGYAVEEFEQAKRYLEPLVKIR